MARLHCRSLNRQPSRYADFSRGEIFVALLTLQLLLEPPQASEHLSHRENVDARRLGAARFRRRSPV